MTFGELSDLLAAAVAAWRLAGIEIAIFNSTLDPTGDLSNARTRGLAPDVDSEPHAPHRARHMVAV